MKPSILVTGVTGRLGKQLAAALNAAQLPWRAYARRADAAKALGASEVVQGDFGQPDQMFKAMQDIACLILISGDDPQQAEQELAVVDAAKKAGVGRIVKLSAQSAGLSQPVIIGRKHLRVEEAIKASGLAWTFVRPVFFQQTFLMFADSVRKGGKIIVPAAKGSVAFVSSLDVAECLVKVASQPGHEGKIYTLTGPESLSFAQAAQVIGKARGKPVSYIAPPAWIARIVLPKASGMPRWLAMEVIDLLQAIAKNAQANVTSDVQTLLGKPPRRFERFVQDHLVEFS